VQRFVEKPTLTLAQALRNQGALWNTFIIAASVRRFISVYEARFAAAAREMRALAKTRFGTRRSASAVISLYKRLTPIDFSRDVLEGQEAMLRVLTVAGCGWTDLGTPARVARTLQQWPDPVRDTNRSWPGQSYLNLSSQYARPAMTGGDPRD
jgi:mannose-1-phosphate guanylyltransferase